MREFTQWEKEVLEKELKRPRSKRWTTCPFGIFSRHHKNWRYQEHCVEICEEGFPRTKEKLLLSGTPCLASCGWKESYSKDYISRKVQKWLKEQERAVNFLCEKTY